MSRGGDQAAIRESSLERCRESDFGRLPCRDPSRNAERGEAEVMVLGVRRDVQVDDASLCHPDFLGGQTLAGNPQLNGDVRSFRDRLPLTRSREEREERGRQKENEKQH